LEVAFPREAVQGEATLNDVVTEVNINMSDQSDKLNLPAIPSYDWVCYNVMEYATRFCWGAQFCN